MIINNPLPADRMYTDDGVLVRVKREPIGSWNMDLLATKQVIFGTALPSTASIMGVQAAIYNDAGDQNRQLFNRDIVETVHQGLTVDVLNSAIITLRRLAAGEFDSPNYDDAVMNRGYLFIWYVQ